MDSLDSPYYFWLQEPRINDLMWRKGNIAYLMASGFQLRREITGVTIEPNPFASHEDPSWHDDPLVH